MSEVFATSGESSDITAGPAPQLQGLFIPGVDNPQFVDGFGVVTPWGGGSTARRYGDYGIRTEVSNQSTQLSDLASSLVPAEGGGATYNLEGLLGPQGLPGKDGITLILHEYTGLNSNFLTALPHNLGLIDDLGTAIDQLIYTDTYSTTYLADIAWTERQPIGDADKSWFTVASDSDGSHLIAGEWSARLWTSANSGADWTERRPAGDVNGFWRDVASDADGTHLIAGAYNERLWTSANSGADWTERRPAGDVNQAWAGNGSDSDGTHLIAGVFNGRLWTSANSGADWTERRPAGDVNHKWLCAASDSDGSHLIAGASAGKLFTSADYGVNWTERQPAGVGDKFWRSVASDADGSHLIAGIYDGRLYTSANSGVNWTERQPAADVDQYWYRVASDSDGSNLIAGAYSGRLWTSDDFGVTWTERRPGGDVDLAWEAVASDANGVNYIAGAYGKRLYTGVGTTYSEATWAETTITSAGRALMDDTTAAAMATTLGLGTGDSPTFAGLHINSPADDDVTLLTLESDISNNTEYNEILFKVSGGLDYGAIRSYVGNTSGDSYMSFFTSTTPGGVLVRQVTIQHDGKVGFGTWWPGERIHVVGNVFITGGIELGHASDTTITRASAGNLNIEGNLVYRAGGTDVPIGDGGTGQSTAQAAIDALTAVSGATNEHVLTKDTATGNAKWKVAAGGGGGTYVDRGDPNGWDYTSPATLTLDAAWHTLDLSGFVGSNAALIHLRVTVYDALQVGQTLMFRKNGNSKEFNVAMYRTQGATAYNTMDCWVTSDSNGVIGYNASAALDNAYVLVAGWILL